MQPSKNYILSWSLNLGRNLLLVGNKEIKGKDSRINMINFGNVEGSHLTWTAGVFWWRLEPWAREEMWMPMATRWGLVLMPLGVKAHGKFWWDGSRALGISQCVTWWTLSVKNTDLVHSHLSFHIQSLYCEEDWKLPGQLIICTMVTSLGKKESS